MQFVATIDQGWHLYSQHLASGGPMPTKFKFEKVPEFELVGTASEPKPEVVYDKMFQMKVQYFSTTATFIQKIKVLTDKPVTVKGTLYYQTCNDESCIPGEAEFSFIVPGNTALAATQKSGNIAEPDKASIAMTEHSDSLSSAVKGQQGTDASKTEI